jgi:hypothetical protein
VQSYREVFLAFIAILLISGVYLGMAAQPNLPAPSDKVGHGIGVLGFILILATESLYSIRKRTKHVRWGQMQTWLQIHIFTGIVGPFMILLHSAFEFHGLAGIVALLMGILVIDGFIGRQIYTAVPRTPEGIVAAVETLEQTRLDVEEDLQNMLPEETPAIFQDMEPIIEGAGIVFGRIFLRRRANAAWRKRLREADAATREQMSQVDGLRKRRNNLVIQIHSIEVATRLLSMWRRIHISIGISFFIAAFVHIGGALYYATLMR